MFDFEWLQFKCNSAYKILNYWHYLVVCFVFSSLYFSILVYFARLNNLTDKEKCLASKHLQIIANKIVNSRKGNNHFAKAINKSEKYICSNRTDRRVGITVILWSMDGDFDSIYFFIFFILLSFHFTEFSSFTNLKSNFIFSNKINSFCCFFFGENLVLW